MVRWHYNYWFTLPVIAALISMILLFILSNIFNLTVSFKNYIEGRGSLDQLQI